MTVLVETDAVGGFGVGLDLLPVALRRVRARMLDVCDSLETEEWQAGSRCELWSVHDVVRHVRDACRTHGAGLRGEPTPFSSDAPFDARTTPLEWLSETAGQAPEETVVELRDYIAAEALALDDRLAGNDDAVANGPYGQVHWTVLSAHVFWDAWLHARDVTEVLGRESPSTPVEEELAAAYGFLIASMPAALLAHPFDLTVSVSGKGGARYTASVAPGRVTLRTADERDEPDLEGDLPRVVDALAGRGPGLESVLHGEPALLEPLTWLRTILRPVV